jgi:hypothetical protein
MHTIISEIEPKATMNEEFKSVNTRISKTS